jgi:hypothetical protein
MSYCCMAVCLTHGRDVYVNIQDRAWVQADGWPCDGMTEALIQPEDLTWAASARASPREKRKPATPRPSARLVCEPRIPRTLWEAP